MSEGYDIIAEVLSAINILNDKIQKLELRIKELEDKQPKSHKCEHVFHAAEQEDHK